MQYTGNHYQKKYVVIKGYDCNDHESLNQFSKLTVINCTRQCIRANN